MTVELADVERALALSLENLSTDNQRAFVREYLLDLNATRAAIRAGYSENSARQAGSELLSNPAIQDALSLAKEARAKRTDISAERVLLEIGRLAFSDLRKVFDAKTGLLPPDEWPDDIALAISSIEVEELFEGVGKDREQIGYTKKVKLWDKVSALDKLGRHLNLWDKDRDSVNVNIIQSIPDADLDARIAAKLAKKKNDGPESPESGG